MHIVTPPEHVVAAQPGARVKVFGPPPGTTGIGSADMLVDSTEHGPVIRGYARPEPEEIAALLRGAVIELAMWGDHLHPWSVGVWTAAPDAAPARPRDTAEDGATHDALDLCTKVAERGLREGEDALCVLSARVGFRAGTRWVAEGGLAGTVFGLLEALGWARPEAIGPTALRALRELAATVGWDGPIPTVDADPVPPYVLALVRALTTGEPLDFGGTPVPGAVQALLDEALGASWARPVRVETRWIVRYDDGAEMDGWTEDTAKKAVADREPRYGAETTYATEAVPQWRYGPSEWADGGPPAPGADAAQAWHEAAERAVSLAQRATDGFEVTVAAIEQLHGLLDEFPDAVPTMRLRMLFATALGHADDAALDDLPPVAGPAEAEALAAHDGCERVGPPAGFTRRTHTTTHVYGEAPCGHRVPVPNEAYDQPVDEATPHEGGDEDGTDVTLCDRRWVVQVVDGEAVFTEHAGRWAWAAAAGASVATDCPDDCPACALVPKAATS